MKKLLIVILLWCSFSNADAQSGPVLNHGTFKKRKIFMSSKPYKPDDWERPYYDSSIKKAFPSDLIKSPESYKDRCIHLVGVVDSVTVNENNSVTFLLDNKYWDYVEDYGYQDEVMLVSEKGDGKFWVTVSAIGPEQLEAVKHFPEEKKLFLVYGTFNGISNSYPVLAALKVKYIDYELYTTKVFSYDLARNDNGEVITDKKGDIGMKNFTFLKPKHPGQNK
jgi:hypothetical protein